MPLAWFCVTCSLYSEEAGDPPKGSVEGLMQECSGASPFPAVCIGAGQAMGLGKQVVVLNTPPSPIRLILPPFPQTPQEKRHCHQAPCVSGERLTPTCTMPGTRGQPGIWCSKSGSSTCRQPEWP